MSTPTFATPAPLWPIAWPGGEAPLASHLIYTQPGVLDDTNLSERHIGIKAGLAWGELADITAVYTDLGLSGGMVIGICRALEQNRPVEMRSLPNWSDERLRAARGPVR